MTEKLVIDARKLGDGGIGVYLENLISGLCDADVFENLSVIVDPKKSAFKKSILYEKLQCKKLQCEKLQCEKSWNKVSLIEESATGYSFAEYFLMPLRLRKVFSNSIVHFPHYTVPFFIPDSAKVVVTVHDCIHLNSRSFLKRFAAKWMLRRALKVADKIITVSNYSKKVILKNFPFVAYDKIAVIANSISPGLVHTKNTQGDYYLYIGSGREYKGLDLLLPALKGEKLVIVGTAFSEVQLEQIEQAGAVLVGQCAVEELSKLYASAKALIMPSYREGFGIPALEALAFGLPVIATPLPSLIEWFGDAIWYAQNFDAKSLRQALEQMHSNPELMKSKILFGLELAKKFSLQNFADQTLKVYQQLVPELFNPTAEYSKVA